MRFSFYRLKLQLQRELEIAHRVGAEKRRREDASQCRTRVQLAAHLVERADERIEGAQADAAEDEHQIDPEHKYLRLSEPERLEERRVDPPEARPAQGVAPCDPEPTL